VIQLFSSLWVTHLAGMGFDDITKAPLLAAPYGFFFVFGCKISFLVGPSLFFFFFPTVVQQLVVILVFL